MKLFTPGWMKDPAKTEKLTRTKKLLKALNSDDLSICSASFGRLYALDKALLKQTVAAKAYNQKLDTEKAFVCTASTDDLKEMILQGEFGMDKVFWWHTDKLLARFTVTDLQTFIDAGKYVSPCLRRLIELGQTDLAFTLERSLIRKGDPILVNDVLYAIAGLRPEQLCELLTLVSEPAHRHKIILQLHKTAPSDETERMVLGLLHEELQEKGLSDTALGIIRIVNKTFRGSPAIREEDRPLLHERFFEEDVRIFLERCKDETAQIALRYKKWFCTLNAPEPTVLTELPGDRALDMVLYFKVHGVPMYGDDKFGWPGEEMQKTAWAVRFLYRHTDDPQLKARIEKEFPRSENYNIAYTYQDSEGDLRDTTDEGTVNYWP